MMEKIKLLTLVDLHLFDGEGAGAAGAGAGTGDGAASAGDNGNQPVLAGKADKNPLASVRYGKQDAAEPNADVSGTQAQQVVSDTKEARKAEFEKLIKGEYKDLYDERAQKMINARFKQNKELEEQANKAKALSPVLDMLADKYGVDASDVDALSKAIQDDDSYYEDEAMDKGLTVDQLKHIKKIERENAEFKRAAEEAQRRENADRIYAQWQQQSEDCQKIYPSFDLQNECSNVETGQRFLGLLKNGIDVQTAFEVIHKDDLIGGAMQYTAQKIQQKTVNDIRARGMRPAENGVSGNSAAVITKTDPKTFTKKDREEIARRVMRGERIEL